MMERVRKLLNATAKHPFLLAILVFDFALVVLPFFDQMNMVTFLWVTGRITNTGPAFANIGWPGGPIFFMVWLPAYIVYIASGLNLYLAILSFKLILFAFLILLGLVVHRICLAEGASRERVLVPFLFLNPAVVYVTLIWIQLDVVPAFFVALTYYLLRYTRLRETTLGMAIVVLPAIMAVFFLYYAVILIPAMIIYSVGSRLRLRLLCVSITLGGAFFLAMEAFLRGWTLSFVSNLDGGGLSSASFEGLQYFLPLTLPAYFAMVVLIATVLPFVMHRYGSPESDAFYLIILLFVFISASAGFNNFIWLFPWALLSSRIATTRSRQILSLIALSSPAFVAVFFANLIMGTGYQQGIFYFGYDVFHYNYQLILTPAEFTKFAAAYNAMLVGAMVLATMHVYGNVGEKTEAKAIRGALQPTVEMPRRPRLLRQVMSRRQLAGITGSIAVVCVLSLVFNAYGPTVVQVNQVNGPFVGLFYPTFLNYQFAMAVDGETYQSQHNMISIFADSPALEFRRNLTDQYVNLSVAYSSLNLIDGYAELINSTPLALSVTHNTLATLQSPSEVTPCQTVNTSASNNSRVSVIDQNVTTYGFNGASRLLYDVPADFADYYYVMAFRMTELPPDETILWYIGNANNTRGTSMIVSYDRAYISYGSKIATIQYTNATIDGWNIVYFHPHKYGLQVGIDGASTYMNSTYFEDSGLFVPGALLRIGFPNNGDQFNYTFYGNATALYRSDYPPSLTINRTVEIRTGSSLIQLSHFSPTLHTTVSDSSMGSQLSVNGFVSSVPGPLGFLALGKLSQGAYGVNVTVQSVRLTPMQNDGFYLVPVFLMMATPYLVTFFIILNNKRMFQPMGRPD